MADKLTLVVPEELSTTAKKYALDERVSLSAVVRGLLEQWTNKEIATPQSAKDEGKDTLSNRDLAGLIAK